MTIGKRIVKYRKEENISQEILADKLNISRQTLSNYENDITTPDLSLATKIAEELNTTLDDLVGNDSKDVLYKKINHTEKIVKKQTKYIKILGIAIYFLVIFGLCLIACYYLFNKDFTTDYQLEFSCYNKKTHENYEIIVEPIDVPYEEYISKKLEDVPLYMANGESSQIENPHVNDRVVTKFMILMDGAYVHGGDTFKELVENLNAIKKIAADQGYTCR